MKISVESEDLSHAAMRPPASHPAPRAPGREARLRRRHDWPGGP
jgi:hypothetical protein